MDGYKNNDRIGECEMVIKDTNNVVWTVSEHCRIWFANLYLISIRILLPLSSSYYKEPLTISFGCDLALEIAKDWIHLDQSESLLISLFFDLLLKWILLLFC